MIDSLEYYLNRDEYGNLRTQNEAEPLDEPFDGLLDSEGNDPIDEGDEDFLDPYSGEDEEDDDDAIDRKWRGEED